MEEIHMSIFQDVEAQGILVNSEFKAVTVLNEKKACSQKSAVGLELDALLVILQKSGVVKKTQRGKFYVTGKSRQKQYKGFKIAIK
jgi:hypothetical protein